MANPLMVRKNSRKRNVTILIVAIFIALGIATAILAIAAFPSQAFNSGVKIKYFATDIDAEVQAWYKEKTGTKTYLTTTEGGTDTVLKLEASEPDPTSGKELFIDKDIVLTKANNYVIFCYEFTNTGTKTIVADHLFTNAVSGVDPVNFDITYSLDGTNFDSINTGFSLTAESTKAYYFKIEVKDLAFNSSLEGAINWDLNSLKNATTNADGANDPVRIGSLSYTTFEEAYAAAQSGDIISLTSNITTSVLNVEKEITIVAEANLNSVTTSGIIRTTSVDEIEFLVSAIRAKNGAKLTLGSNNGTAINLQPSDDNVAEIIVANGNASLYLGNVKIIAPNDSSHRVIHLNDTSSLEINGGEISGFNYSEPGAVIYGHSPTTTIIKNLSLLNNNSSKQGGAVYNDGNLIIDNCIFNGNYARIGGGAIFTGNKEANISNTTFLNNSCASFGGAIYTGSGNINISNCTFTSNNSSNHGGAVHSDGTITILNSRFKNNTASASGGALSKCSTIINCTFEENSAGSGGAIYDCIKIISNSTFINNESRNEGGAIYLSRPAQIIDSKFEGNNAKNGGAISGCANLNNSIFKGNIASEYGGAIRVGGAFRMTSCTFEENSSSLNGGALFINAGQDNVIKNNEFINNSSDASGGAIYLKEYYGGLTIDGLRFSSNTAQQAGAIIAEIEFTLTNSTFEGNLATAGNGGAIYLKNGTISNCEFSTNKATQNGGSIWAESGTVNLSNSNFTGNESTLNGGAIHFANASSDILNCKFISNKASADGGAIRAIGTSSLTISGTTKITNNTASVRGGGITLVDASRLIMDNGEISTNKVSKTASAVYGGGVYVNSGCTFTMNAGTIHNNTTSGLYTFGGNVYLTDSLFEFKGGIISGDGSTKQAKFGGGVTNMGTFIMTGGTISKCVSEIGSGVSNGGTATITGGLIVDCVASNNVSNAGKAIANNGTLNLGNVSLGSGQDITMGYQNAEIAGIPESYGILNVVEKLTDQYIITFAQITTKYLVSLQISAGEKAITQFTGGTVFATYLNEVVADATNFVTSGYTFYVSNGNVYMKAA